MELVHHDPIVGRWLATRPKDEAQINLAAAIEDAVKRRLRYDERIASVDGEIGEIEGQLDGAEEKAWDVLIAKRSTKETERLVLPRLRSAAMRREQEAAAAWAQHIIASVRQEEHKLNTQHGEALAELAAAQRRAQREPNTPFAQRMRGEDQIEFQRRYADLLETLNPVIAQMRLGADVVRALGMIATPVVNEPTVWQRAA